MVINRAPTPAHQLQTVGAETNVKRLMARIL
jgi:hypothetical protein